MEDRHSVSEPRPVVNGGGLPSWEVDILRDDALIVDTFWLNNDVLPPRTNKKGKVVWRLPDTTAKLPSFGKDDRRRILDIFKDRKKQRKLAKKKRNDSSPTPSGDPAGNGKCERRDSTHKSPGVKGSGDERGTGSYDQLDSHSKPPEGKGSGEIGVKPKIKGKENGKSSENVSNPRGRDNVEVDVQPERGRGAPPKSLLPSAPFAPGLDATRPTPLSQLQHHPTQLHSQVPSTPDPSRMSLDDSQDLSTSNHTQPSLNRPPYSSQTSFTQPPPADALFITVPTAERPESLQGQPESSLAVPAARHFISKYYSHFDGTLPGAHIGDLIRYYTSKAQKSVSIGGAHSVVAGRRDIAAQILNFAGAAFVVRGVVAQDTADRRGVHILVTGTARTSLNGSAGGVVASFAHSISLVPIEDGRGIGDEASSPTLREAFEIGFPFQIHNDALALLSGDGPVTPTPIPQPLIPLQQPAPPPPPGLF